MNFLIVDDHPTNRKLLRAQLEAAGHGVLDAADGIEALEVLERESVDGVISDILMPNMDGFRLCLEIRKSKKLSRLPFVFYTSTYKSPQDRELARTVGADQYLTKPAATHAILGALEEAMQKTRERIAVSAARYDETYVLKQYSEALVRKLEERNTEVEVALKNLQAAHDRMRESEARKAAVIETALDCVVTIDHEGKILEFNPAAEKTFGYSRAEVIGMPMADCLIPPSLRERHQRAFDRYLLTGEATILNRRIELIAKRRDGSEFPAELTVGRVGADAAPVFTAFLRDITERKQAEISIRRLNRVYAVLSGINTLIVRVRDRQQLFNEACRIAVEQGNFGMAWIGMLDSTTLDVTPVAWAGPGADQYLGGVKSSIRENLPTGQGILAQALRTREPAFDNDIAKSPGVGGPRRTEAIRLGYRSFITLPLTVDRNVVGNLSLFSKEEDFFNKDEVRLLAELAGDISFAMEHVASQQKIEKLSRIRAVSSEVNAAIVRIRDQETLLQETCRIAAERGKFELVWIGEINAEGQKIRPVASRGFSLKVAHAVSWASISNAQGTLGEAIRTRKPAVRNDIQSDLPSGGLRQEAMKQGCYSTVCLPLVVDDSVAALIVLFAAGTGFFDEDELALLAEMTADVSFALQSIARQEKVEYLSYFDALTGLPNRTLFLDRAGREVRSSRSEPLMMALVLLNLERFRNINETYGRHGGDELLKLVAQRIESAFHGKDYLARIGADSFSVVISKIRDVGSVAHAVENQLLGCFRDPFKLNDTELRVSARAGIALYPADGSDADTVFKNAEAALKKAKDSGERYLFYAADMNARAAHALSLETRLRKAVEAQQFVLYYQPKINLANDSICGLEALIRWQDPESGLVPPGAFIPLLEETGLILEVGKWAVLRALAQHREWTARGVPAPRIAVNVSAIQLQRKDFADGVIDALRQEGDNPDALELEVTESLLMKDVQESIRKLSILRARRIHIAMDDFGTGYSSLSYMTRLPINSVKIDRSFINGMTGSPQDMGIVTTIIALAHSMNLKVVAEGVETEEQSQLLKLLQCDEVQGFLYSKPRPAAEIEQMLRARPQAAVSS
jgi:PAS domain S-box-containing protein/diguanylate cyclase (GGDEF)-like protein